MRYIRQIIYALLKQNCALQIKLNLHVVVTNIQLFGFGLIESENCKFCNKAPETLHLFLHISFCYYILGKCFSLHL